MVQVKSLPTMQKTRDSIPGLGRSPGEGNGNSLQDFLAWKIPWMEELSGYNSWSLKELDTTERLHFLPFHSNRIHTIGAYEKQRFISHSSEDW